MSGFPGDLSAEQEAALGAFKAKFAKEAGESGLPAEDVNLWGVDVSNLQDSLTKPQQTVLLKFLRAREFDVDAATEMAIKCLKWRKDFNVRSLESEEFLPAFAKAGFVYGRTKEGCPVTYNTYGDLAYETIFKNGPDTFIRWRVQLMEKAVVQLDFEKGIERVMQIHDYSGAGLFSMNKDIRAASKDIISLFQDNYPEFLERKFFLHVPTIMEWIFSLLSVLSSARTTSKFAMVSSGNVRSTLLQYIDPTNLPPVYGGFEAEATSQEASKGIEKVIIEAGKKKVVEQQVSKASSEVKVEWIVEGSGDIAVGVHAGTDDDGVKTERAESGKGSVKLDKPGIVRVIFDNSYSRMTAKDVLYRVTIV